MSNRWCRDCVKPINNKVKSCPKCHSYRLFHHQEASELGIAHLDCDAFFASVEKRDNPKLANLPILIGGTGARAVVATACYLARAFGVHSAMSMRKAKQLCPQAIIVPPRMAAYAKASNKIRQLMLELTPLVEPISIDEAFLDLTGTKRLHGALPVQIMMQLQKRIEQELGLGVSIGLSYNKFLAKTASDLDKPRGFSVIGRAETLDFLGPHPPTFVSGVGPSFGQKLKNDGIYNLQQIHKISEQEMAKRYGQGGLRLSRLSRGLDNRKVNPVPNRKSISTETTFEQDISDLEPLQKILWSLCEKTSHLAKQKHLAGYTLTLKLKNSTHHSITRSITLDGPVQLADTLFRELDHKLRAEVGNVRFRLIGVGLSSLIAVEADFLEPVADLLESSREKHAKTERAIDKVREKFGPQAIIKGRVFPSKK